MAKAAKPAPPPPRGTFQPYVPATQSPAEFTIKAITLGAVFGLIFGASTVYLGLRAGLTVSASIPIAVLAIAPQVSRNVPLNGSFAESGAYTVRVNGVEKSFTL